MPYRHYSSTAQATSLTADVTAAATSLAVTRLDGYPAVPFTASIDQGYPDLAEVVEVTAVSGTTLTVLRGVDGTTGKEHKAGAAVVHTTSARDFTEAAESRGAGRFARQFLFGGSA